MINCPFILAFILNVSVKFISFSTSLCRVYQIGPITFWMG